LASTKCFKPGRGFCGFRRGKAGLGARSAGLKAKRGYSSIFSRARLAEVRAKAVRRGVWFRTLSGLERAQIDLTIRLVEKVQSRLLTQVLNKILGKLFEAMESRVSRLMREVGTPLAEKLSVVGKSWGCKSASSWARDPGFIKFLTVNYMNTSRLFKATP